MRLVHAKVSVASICRKMSKDMKVKRKVRISIFSLPRVQYPLSIASYPTPWNRVFWSVEPKQLVCWTMTPPCLQSFDGLSCCLIRAFENGLCRKSQWRQDQVRKVRLVHMQESCKCWFLSNCDLQVQPIGMMSRAMQKRYQSWEWSFLRWPVLLSFTFLSNNIQLSYPERSHIFSSRQVVE